MNNWLLKYFSDVCEIYTCIKYFVVSNVYFQVCLNFINTIMAVDLRYSANEISKCFI